MARVKEAQNDSETQTKRPFEMNFDESTEEIAGQVSHLAGVEPEEVNEDDSAEKFHLQAQAFDIFEDVGEPQTKAGDVIRYIVKKYGQHISTKYHPLSWEKIRQEFGPGQYTVIARSESRKRYVKSETRMLGEGASQDVKQAPQAAPREAEPAGGGFMEYMALMQKMSADARAEAREMAKESQASQQQMLTMFMGLMGEQQKASQQMFFEIAKLTQTVSEKMTDSQSRLLERVERRIAEQERPQAQSPSLDPLQILSMMQKAEDRGFDRFSMLQEVAEAKAAQNASLVETIQKALKKRDDEDDDEDEPKNESVTDTLIKTMLPTIASALVQPGVPQAPTSQSRRMLPQQPTRMVPGRSPLPGTVPAQAPRRIPTRPGVAQAPHRAADPRTSGPGAAASGRIGQAPQASRSAIPKTQELTPPESSEPTLDSMGLPTLAQPAPAQVNPQTRAQVNPQARDQVNPQARAQVNPQARVQDHPQARVQDHPQAQANPQLREELEDLLLPEIGQLLMNAAQPQAAVDHCIQVLEKKGHSRTVFVENIRKRDILEIIRRYGLDQSHPETLPWFEEFYARFAHSTGVAARE